MCIKFNFNKSKQSHGTSEVHIQQFFCSLAHSFSKSLLSEVQVSSTVLGAAHTVVNKTDTSHEAGRSQVSYTCSLNMLWWVWIIFSSNRNQASQNPNSFPMSYTPCARVTLRTSKQALYIYVPFPLLPPAPVVQQTGTHSLRPRINVP